MQNGMELTYKPYDLQLKHVFTIAGNSRKHTPVVLTKLNWEGITGYGEASLPPYLGEDQESVARFLSKLDLGKFKDPLQIDDILDYVNRVAGGNHAAKASVDIALHDLFGKIKNKPLHQIWQLNPAITPNTSFTIGMDKTEIMQKKVEEASIFKILKVKLGAGKDKEMIEAIRSVWDGDICVDVNQGWSDKEMALDMLHWLSEMQVVFVEQPMEAGNLDSTAWLNERSPLPIIADEDVQGLDDVKKLNGVYSGINIKLMKCSGLREARKMIKLAEEQQMDIMLGCMTETSVAISAAAQLSPIAKWADLDGNLLINNDPFSGIQIINGRITLNNNPGIGVRKI